MKCPFVTDPKKIDRNFNKPITYNDSSGQDYDYIFFDHNDGFGKITRVQFCDLVGRKRNVFECFNEKEWKDCYAYKMGIKKKGGK